LEDDASVQDAVSTRIADSGRDVEPALPALNNAGDARAQAAETATSAPHVALEPVVDPVVDRAADPVAAPVMDATPVAPATQAEPSTLPMANRLDDFIDLNQIQALTHLQLVQTRPDAIQAQSQPPAPRLGRPRKPAPVIAPEPLQQVETR